MNALLIVDPQNDFITGSLSVPGALEAMGRLAGLLDKMPVTDIFVTMDCHPFDHMSFKDNGGIWPRHCVKYSEGAALLQPLIVALGQAGGSKGIHFIEKGTERDKEEYSAFETGYPPLFDEAEQIFVTGIAGDVCVKTSITDLARHGLSEKLVVIPDFCPSLDGGRLLEETIRNLNLRTETPRGASDLSR